PSVVLLAGMLFMPETPRFLVHAGEEDTAHDVLEDLPGDEPPGERIEEIREVEQHEESGGGLSGLIRAKWVRPALLVAVGLAAFITLICLATVIASFAATWGPVVWVMLPEVLPLSVRGTAMGVAVFGNWGANFLVSQTFPPLVSGLGPGPVFLGYAGLGILAGLFVMAFVTETKGRSLE